MLILSIELNQRMYIKIGFQANKIIFEILLLLSYIIMGGSSLQFLLTFILLLLYMKPNTGNNLGLADTHFGYKEHERQALLKIK